MFGVPRGEAAASVRLRAVATHLTYGRALQANDSLVEHFPILLPLPGVSLSCVEILPLVPPATLFLPLFCPLVCRATLTAPSITSLFTPSLALHRINRTAARRPAAARLLLKAAETCRCTAPPLAPPEAAPPRISPPLAAQVVRRGSVGAPLLGQVVDR